MIVAALTAAALIVAMWTTGGTRVFAYSQPDLGPPDLINLSALQLPATLADGQTYAGGFYSATAAQISSLENLEAQAVQNTMSDHALAAGDFNAVLSWARPDADAELWALLVQAIEAVKAGNATQDQTNAVDWLTAVAGREAVVSADDAGFQYTEWAGLGTSTYSNLITSGASQTDLTNFLSGAPNPYTGSGSATNTSGSTDGGYCVYSPPSPDQGQYTAGVGGSTADQTCFTPCTNVFGCVPPYPTLTQFEDWGDAEAVQALFNNPDFATANETIAQAATMGSVAAVGSVAAGVGTAFALGSVLSGTAFQTAVFPFAARALTSTAGLAEDAGTAAGETAEEATQAALDAAEEVGGEVAATGVGVIVAAVIFAVTTAVQEGLTVVAGNQLPGQLAQLIADAPSSPPDLTSELGNGTDMQGLFALFVGSTLPSPTYSDCANNTGPRPVFTPATPCLNPTATPPQSSGDPQWVITPKGSTTSTTQATITWQDAVSGLTTTAFLHGNWFVDSASVNGVSATVQSLRFQYTDWQGNENTAWLFGNENPAHFLVIPNSALGSSFDPSTCQSAGTCSVTTSIDFVGADGHDYSASVKPGVEAPPLPPDPTFCSSTVLLDCVTALQPSSTSLSASPSVAQVNQPVTLTAYVNGVAPFNGTVDFSSGTTDLCTGVRPALTEATCTTTFTTPGTEVIFATFSGDTGLSLQGGTGDAPSQGVLILPVVNPVSTTTALSASTLTPVVGQPVTYTATVSSNGPAPTGTVTFTNGSATVCASVALSTASPYIARCSQTYAAIGGQTVTASYSGDAYTTGSQTQIGVVVGQASTATSVSASTSTPVVGQPVTYTATISALSPDTSGPAPTGTVTFTNGTTTVCSAVPLSTAAPYTATCAQTYQGPSAQTLSASYSGDANTLGSEGQVTVMVGKASSGISISASTSTPVVGQPVTYTATVSASPPDSGGPPPTGTVTFTNGTTTVCSAVSLSTASPYTATCMQTYQGPGPQTLGASYSGDANTLGSQGQVTVTVGKASSTVSVSVSTSTPVVGQPVTYTATVSTVPPDTGGPAPTGTVTFTNGTTTVCSAVPLSTTSPHTATCTQTYQGTGGQTVTAAYSGDTNTSGSKSQVGVTVTKAGTSTALATSPSAPSFGQPIIFKATVSALAPSTAGPALTGTVTFTLDGQPIATGAAFNGSQAQSAAVYNLAPGSHTAVATYSGDANYLGSSGSSSPTVTCTQTINVATSGSLTVTGSSCVEAGGSVSGPVTVEPGGSLAVIGGTLDGPVTANGAAGVLICGTTVGGPLSLTGSTGPITLGGTSGSACGPDQLDGKVTITGAQAAVSIEGSTISGSLSVTSGTGTVNVSSNTVGGPVTVSSNSSPTAATVSGNTIAGPLDCTQNATSPTDSGVLNESGPAGGQCAGLG